MPSGSVKVILKGLEDDSTARRRNAAEALAFFPGPEVTLALGRAYLSTYSVDARRAVLDSLVGTRPAEAAAFFAAKVPAAGPEIAGEAKSRRSPAEPAKPAETKSLQRIAYALGRSRRAEAIPPLLALVWRSEPEVRNEALMALARCRSKESDAAIQKGLTGVRFSGVDLALGLHLLGRTEINRPWSSDSSRSESRPRISSSVPWPPVPSRSFRMRRRRSLGERGAAGPGGNTRLRPCWLWGRSATRNRSPSWAGSRWAKTRACGGGDRGLGRNPPQDSEKILEQILDGARSLEVRGLAAQALRRVGLAGAA